jgi:hypothetical protein
MDHRFNPIFRDFRDLLFTRDSLKIHNARMGHVSDKIKVMTSLSGTAVFSHEIFFPTPN